MAIDLCLDISRRNTGIVWDRAEGGCPHSKSFTAPSVEKAGGGGYPMGRTLARYRQMLVETIQIVKPDRITFEAPLMGQKNTMLTTRLLFNLAGVTEEAAFSTGNVPCFEVSVQTARKAFVGNGHCDKEAVRAQCHRLGWFFDSLDKSDAAAVWWTAKTTADPRWRPDAGFMLFQEGKRR